MIDTTAVPTSPSQLLQSLETLQKVHQITKAMYKYLKPQTHIQKEREAHTEAHTERHRDAHRKTHRHTWKHTEKDRRTHRSTHRGTQKKTEGLSKESMSMTVVASQALSWRAPFTDTFFIHPSSLHPSPLIPHLFVFLHSSLIPPSFFIHPSCLHLFFILLHPSFNPLSFIHHSFIIPSLTFLLSFNLPIYFQT